MLSFQRLDVYQRAIEFLGLVGAIVDDLPKGRSERRKQLVRAAESVVRNIVPRKLVAPQSYDRGIRLLEAIVAMLTKML